MEQRKKELSTVYLNRQVQFENKLSRIRKKLLWISILRLFLFVAGGVCFYFAFKYNPDFLVYIILFFVILFLLVIKIHNNYFGKKDYLLKLIEVNQNELDALEGKINAFDDGEKFLVSDKQELHFTIDFDVFGKDSLYQFLNRTVTVGGAKVLSHTLKFPEKSKNNILKKQSAIRELAENIEFRQSFAATGLTVVEVENEYKQIVDWLAHPDIFLQKKIFSILTNLIPIVNILLITLAVLEIVSWNLLGLSMFLSLVFVGFWQKHINKLHLMVSKKVAILHKYEHLLRKIERESFSSDLLKELKEKLHVKGQTSVRVIKNLSLILSALDNRLNILVGVLLNSLFIWDIRQILRLEKWKTQYGKELVVWFAIIGKFDSLMSFANFAYNHSEYVYPEISDSYFELIGKDLKHPLMEPEFCVANDLEINSSGKFIVITGANMAGKSTLLRTLGVNLLLGMSGSPVSAKSLKFYPVDLVSSLRVNDSLKKNTSYFYAEIQRMEYIIQQLKGGKEIFVLLDEILRGTNSADKEQGSKALLKQLLHLNAAGIIATHDLNLAHLAEEFGDKIQTQCFEVEVVGDELVFDYKLRPGTSKNLSATFLMKKMGITV